MSRRLNFLWYILNENDDTLINQFFMAQLNNPVKDDWVSRVKQDLHDLELNLQFDEIKSKSKNEFKGIVRSKVYLKAFEYLKSIQQTKTKSKNITYKELDLLEYLKPQCKLTIQEKSFTFATRTNMLDLKTNSKVGQTDLCRNCTQENETQKHTMTCPSISDSSVVMKNKLPIYEEPQTKLKLQLRS